MGRMFEALKIVAFATFAAITYGILHDQITAHLCVEYFTIAHPPVFPTSSPFLLAIGWGIIATWWVGLSLGLGLAFAAQFGRAPTIPLRTLRRPIILLMLVCGGVALVAGLSGAALVGSDVVGVLGMWGAVIPESKHVAFSAAAYAHLASYVSGAIAGVFLMLRTAWLRTRLAKTNV
tara:strand:- start:190 stop:720 length:531 start_codon:yes stop_codon:yes gene_type:complete